jgi:pimeloyl-ACP methyl ester carboxylesterase
MQLGYELIGFGTTKVIVLHDWFCDHTSYKPMYPYLNQQDFQYAFLDMRGYGQSKNTKGTYTLDEATQDVLDTADRLGWDQFHLIGYSMTGLVAQNVMALAQSRVKSLIAIGSVTADGYSAGADESVFAFMTEAALGDDQKAVQIAQMMTSNKYDREWAEYKVKRWRDTSTADARIGYLVMFVKSNILAKIKGLPTKILVICTSEDHESLRKPAVESTFGKWYPNVEILEISNSGHNPMQEVPVSLATAINRYLSIIP